jgi:hypothetical protein
MLLLSHKERMSDVRIISKLYEVLILASLAGPMYPKNLFTNCQRNSKQELKIEVRILTTLQSSFDPGKSTEVRYDTHHFSSADGLA